MSSLISPEYLKLNRELHERRPDYGTSGHKWALLARKIMFNYGCKTALDYGCGKATLAEALDEPSWLRCYDPAIEKYSDPPEPADLVICGDVLEHIEPEHIDAVLDDLGRLAQKLCLLVVAVRPAVKTLADGRNAHLIVEPTKWWLGKILKRFDLVTFTDMGGMFVAVVKPDG